MSADRVLGYGLGKLAAELPELLDRAKAAGLAWLELDLGADARIVAVWPTAEPLLADETGGRYATKYASPTPAQIAQGARQPLPWDHYAPELRDELKGLAGRFPPDAVADAAVRLAELIALHPPRARQAPK